MTALSALFFDVDDTLFSTSAFAAAARQNAMQAMLDLGVEMELEDLLGELAEVVSEFGSNYGNHYDQLLKRLPAGVLPHGNTSVLVSAAMVAYHDTKFRELLPYPDVHDTLRRLREGTSLRMGVITAGLRVKQAEKLVRLGVLPWLDRDALFISDEVGISKPNPKLYQRACRAVTVSPEDTLYVGDHPVHDIAAAHALGITTVRFRSPEGKHKDAPNVVTPAHEIHAFSELLPIVGARLGLTL